MKGVSTIQLARAFLMNLPTIYQGECPNGFARYLNRLDKHYTRIGANVNEIMRISLEEHPVVTMDGR